MIDPENILISGNEEIERACSSVSEAKPGLRNIKVKDRIAFIRKLKEIILTQRESIIDRIQNETGKSRSDALMSEIFGVLDHLVYLEGNADKILSDKKVKTPIALMGKKSRIYYEPLGTILIISPWNYPFYQAIVPITASFVAGNTIIYKPSEFTPLEGLIEKLLEQAGFDENWVKVVYGDGETGAKLIDKNPDKIFFTGSDRTGKLIMAKASQYLIPVELELGGKDPMIVFDDVNIQRAAAGALWGGITNLGQSCTSVERIYVQRSIFEPFKKELIRLTESIKQETDSDGDADVGSMTTDFQLEIIAEQLNNARAKGAVIHGKPWNSSSKMVPPMVIENVDESMKMSSEETFGPTMPVIPFDTEEDAVALANNSDYGLSASVWSKDVKRADRVARRIVTGNVSINNVMLTEGNSGLPFGGTKNSGFGRYKGEAGLHSFCNIKSLLIDTDSSKIEANWFPYTKKKYRLFSDLTEKLFSGGFLSLIKVALAGMKLESYADKVGKKGRDS